MSPERRPTPRIRRHASLALWLANLLVAVVIGLNYLAHVPEVDSPKMWLFALPALVSTAVMLTLLPGGVFTLLASVLGTRVLGTVQAIFWTLFQILLYADTRIYNMFRYHFNGQVLNLVYTRGSEDAIHLGWQVWTAISIGFGALIALELWLWKRSLRWAEKHGGGMRVKSLLRPSLIWGVVLLPAVFLEKTIYAQADLSRDRQVTTLARLFPLYARLPAEDLASKVLGVEVDKPPRVALDGFELAYPRAYPELDADGPRPNVLIVVVDCLRKDMLTSETTPRLHAWAEESLRFEDHLSGGNSTRYGVFSMIYGLHGSYWFPCLQEQRSPVLIDVLDDLGYEFGIFGSASMNYPELRETAWVEINESVHDQFDAPLPWRRDELAAEAMIEWLESRGQGGEGAAPFFGFILLDSPHQTYSHPPDAQRFAPSAPEIDYMSMTRNDGPEKQTLDAVRNRYKNAVFHADEVAGRILEALEGLPAAEDTLVVVTGDHGEEFLECGFFGHTSAFTPEQVAVPFLLRGPGVAPGFEYGPTSHLDLPTTLLEMLGADASSRADWSLGENLFEPAHDRRRVVSGWNELGVWTPEGILRVPLSLFEFDVELYDYGWRLQLDDRAALTAESRTLERLGADCNRFLR